MKIIFLMKFINLQLIWVVQVFFTGDNDANIMHNSCMINLNILKQLNDINQKNNINKTKFFIHHQHVYIRSIISWILIIQIVERSPHILPHLTPEYGWEKLFSEHLYFTYHRNFNIPVRVARYHNIYGPEGLGWR